MTKATTEGRRLVLTVDGIDEPFLVDPIPARRGRILTDLFIRISTGLEPGGARAESVFIEAVNPRNYARMAGQYVDEFDSTGRYEKTWAPAGVFAAHPELSETTSDALFVGREARQDLATPEPELDGEPIRQEECQSLSLCAFYWQTVVGIEAVNAFLEAGEGTGASLKALNLLLIRLGLSPSTSSSQRVTELLTQQDDSEETTATGPTSGSVLLPANRRGYQQNPAKKTRRKFRR